MKLYVYCLAENIDPPAAPVSGISGAQVDVRRVADFSLLVSELEVDSVPVTRENALTHDNVIRSVMNETTPLPFRFGSVVTGEQLAGYLNTHRANLKTRLAQVRGCFEMSVKIISDPDDTQSVVERNDAGPGATFLEQKRRELLGGERRAETAKQVAAWLKDHLGAYVRKEEISLCPTEKLIVAAAHLVSREQVTKYRERLTEARKTRPELHFLVSGPWPPYTFSNIELEFKTRFGVS
jgi:hypothetical protein